MIPTIKVVVIGSSGVGKTSLRGKYISGRFSAGYKATIGTDFITKTVAVARRHRRHRHRLARDGDGDGRSDVVKVALQIWDTAGQERFSSLSGAFFRGADAAVLMFDVNDRSTMRAMERWWSEFCDRALGVTSVADERNFCCVVVGNKIDVVQFKVGDAAAAVVSESEALKFLEELVPRPPMPRVAPTPHSREPSHSPKHNLSKSRSRSSSRFYAGTMTSTHTVYHTPSSSDVTTATATTSSSSVYHSARSSPVLPYQRRRAMTALSTESARTITPSLIAREREERNGSGIASPHQRFPSSASSSSSSIPSSPEIDLGRGRPRLFFTSAKTGQGVDEVFEYIAESVIRRWECEEEWRLEEVEGNGRRMVSVNVKNESGRAVGSCC